MKIYLDYDSTLVAFDEAYLSCINERYGTNYTSKDLVTWAYVQDIHGKESEVWKERGFYSKVFPIENAQWFVSVLRLMYGEENVNVLTSSARATKDEKHEHIKYYFRFQEKQIIHAHEKHVHTHDGVLIDDYIKNVSAHIEHNSNVGILYNKNCTYGWCPAVEDTELLKTFHDYHSILHFLKYSNLK